MKHQRLIYVAYAPYENQGKILDYILETYSEVFLFTIGHHNLGKKEKTNTLRHYSKGKLVKEINLYHIPVSSKLVFSILPFRSLLNLFQIITLTRTIVNKHGVGDVYFSVNGYAATIGVFLKKLGYVKKTVYWICDYYPIMHSNIIVHAVRWLYWKFEKVAAKSDRLVFHNKRLVKVWRDAGHIPQNKKFPLVPIATNKSRIKKNKNFKSVKLVFLGVLKKSQGLDFIFDTADLLKSTFKDIQIAILGAGPDMEHFQTRAGTTNLKSKFYGYSSEETIDKVIYNSTIGVAPYQPDPTAVSFYGDPGKIKRYISLGIPVIATNIHEFPKELKKQRAGEIVEYGNQFQLVQAIKKINKSYSTYSRNAAKLNDSFYYKKIYPTMFDE